jgi:hypothetical protein
MDRDMSIANMVGVLFMPINITFIKKYKAGWSILSPTPYGRGITSPPIPESRPSSFFDDTSKVQNSFDFPK